MAINFLLKRSNTASKRPTAAQLDIGELSLNYDANTAGVFFEDSAGSVRKVGPAEVSATAPNATPAGSSGNSLGELWYDTGTSTLKVWTGATFANAMGTATAAGNNTEVQFNSSGVLGASSSLTWNGSLLTATLLKSSQSSGDEGGQLDLAAPVTNTTITTGVSIDVWQNLLRIFETGGTNRGAKMDITAQAASVGSTIATSANKLSIFAATTSAELAGVISDETGSGSLVFATSPSLTTPAIGAATGTSLSLTGGSLTVRTAATQDGVILAGRAGGTGTFDVTITPTTLSADRTLTLADGNTTLQAGTMAITGGTLAQFASTTSSQLAGVISDETGSGSLVFATSPSLTTPSLGVASATSINKVAITAPATSATLTIADGKTLTVSNTLTFTGTDSSSVAFGAGGTVAYTGGTLAQFAATTSAQLAGVISDETGSGALVFGTSPAITTSLTTGSASFDLINTTATTVNFAGAATALTIGATSGTTTVRNDFNRSGNISASSWTTGGISIDSAAATFTDTSSAGGATVASRVAVSVNTPTFASTNAITVTNAASFYISAAPTAGSNTTITNPYALWVDAGVSRFDGNVMPGADNSHNLGSTALRWANIYTGDLHLKNDRGDYTIIEEEDALTLRNNKTGKVYNFVLQERV